MTGPMTAAAAILSWAILIGMLILALAFLLTVWRVVRGPTLPDRVVALDMLVGIVIGFIALIAIRTGFTLYIDIAISLGLVGFLATVAFARFIMPRVGAQPEGGSVDEIVAGAVPAEVPRQRAKGAKRKAGTEASRGRKKS